MYIKNNYRVIYKLLITHLLKIKHDENEINDFISVSNCNTG